MRLKTDVRREAILAIATELFREVGYERASMAMISARIGGSKTTLYNYFKSKEELFAAAMMEAMEERGEELTNLLDPGAEDVEKVLRRFAKAYVALVTAPEALAITRTAVAEGTSSGLGPALYRRGPQRGWQQIADYLRQLQERGVLGGGTPELMAVHLKGLLEAGMVEPLLFGAKPELSADIAINAAVSAFLRAYRTPDWACHD